MDALTLALLASLFCNGVQLVFLTLWHVSNYPLKKAISNWVLLFKRSPLVYIRKASSLPTEPSRAPVGVKALGSVDDLAKEAIGAVKDAFPKVSADMASVRNKNAVETKEVLIVGHNAEEAKKMLESL